MPSEPDGRKHIAFWLKTFKNGKPATRQQFSAILNAHARDLHCFIYALKNGSVQDVKLFSENELVETENIPEPEKSWPH
jgi:hypothetical protein